MHLIQRKLLEASRRKSFEGLTLREIGELIGLNHPQLIKHHLYQLIKKGLLDSKYHPLNTDQSVSTRLISIPVLGSANCGEPTRLAEENLEGYLKVSPNLLQEDRTGDLFALKAVGDSMNRAKISKGYNSIDDGDYVIVDSGYKSPTNGEYVVSIIDGAANVKRFFFDDQKQLVYLLSDSSSDYPPIVIKPDDDFTVNGRVIHVIKNRKG